MVKSHSKFAWVCYKKQFLQLKLPKIMHQSLDFFWTLNQAVQKLLLKILCSRNIFIGNFRSKKCYSNHYRKRQKFSAFNVSRHLNFIKFSRLLCLLCSNPFFLNLCGWQKCMSTIRKRTRLSYFSLYSFYYIHISPPILQCLSIYYITKLHYNITLRHYIPK